MNREREELIERFKPYMDGWRQRQSIVFAEKCADIAEQYAQSKTSELQTEIDRLKAENEELQKQVYKPQYIAANSIYTQYFVSQHDGIMTNYNNIDPITKETKVYECNVEIKAGHIYYPKITENGLEVIDLTT